MKKLKKYLKLIIDPAFRFSVMASHGFFKNMSDEKFLKTMYNYKFGKKLNLENPATFNEKLQWLKLYDIKDKYTEMVDKYEVKKYVSSIIGNDYIIPSIGIWDSFEDIDFNKLPNQFVLKCTHDSGGLVICRDKSKLDIKKARKRINRSLKRNYFWNSREWPYKNVKPRIMAEQYIEDSQNNEHLPVYKFFCFDGEPKIIQTIQNDKQPNETIDYFDLKWQKLDIRQNYPNSEHPLPKPLMYDKMVSIVKKLAEEKKGFIRVDLYNNGCEIFFSEYTFFSDSGFSKFVPEKWDKELGEWLNLEI